MLTKLKQFKDLRSQAKELQSQLANETATAEAAGGKVVLTMDGNLALKGVAIDDDLLTPSKKEKLQDAIKKAHGEALKSMQRTMAMKMKDMGGLNIPGMG
ncbi:MAG: YbaB/EbfC family nucleoid-associated protein [Candidatus Magasanikbacteria bacterium]|jgi:DNA-binding YbaB/EbfC family protein|nr:YbaB/EbfC family nucleoid-associated protein [Candidatus Magasanikbacteria bacterium]